MPENDPWVTMSWTLRDVHVVFFGGTVMKGGGGCGCVGCLGAYYYSAWVLTCQIPASLAD
eukprot:83855-Karenia_brevis.AAC.1